MKPGVNGMSLTPKRILGLRGPGFGGLLGFYPTMNEGQEPAEVNRRDFLKNTSAAAFMAMMGGVELTAPRAAADGDVPLTKKKPVPAVRLGVIGAGGWGRKIITNLGLLKNTDVYQDATVTAVCDSYPSALRRAVAAAPGAVGFEDYKKLLAAPEVDAVVVATPTHLHRDIVIDALQAGKHVYCEMPLAGSIDDTRAVARAAQAAFKQFFQAGLVERSSPQRHFVQGFVRAGAMARNVFVRAQSHQKNSWRKTDSNADRAKALNWRLDAATSTGLMGEACINLLDSVPWYLGGSKRGGRPNAVTGFSSTILWNDGRSVPDTAQCVFEFPEGPNAGVRFVCDATLCNHFESEYELYCGSDAAILVQPGNERRESQAWMFKEADAAMLGWEPYAIHSGFGAEVGISLRMNASKQAAQEVKKTVGDVPPEIEPLQYSLQSFVANCANLQAAVKAWAEDFPTTDTPEFRANLAGVRKYNIDQYPAAGWEEGLEATVLAIKANEAAVGHKRIELPKELFEL